MESSRAPQVVEKAREQEIKVTKSKSFINRLFGCFNPSENGSESELDAENDYLVMNHSVYKIPKPNQDTDKISKTNSDSEPHEDDQNIAYQYDSDRKGGKKRVSKLQVKSRSPQKTYVTRVRDEEEYEKRVYEYIRMKTYEKMNPYHMNPNDFLNNLSSVFVDNLKDPVPKDPLNLPRIFNRYIPRQGYIDRSKGSKNQKSSLRSDLKSTKRQKKFGMISRNVETRQEDGPFSYKEAIEDDEPYSDVEEKVLIWKIVVVNEKNEDKQ